MAVKVRVKSRKTTPLNAKLSIDPIVSGELAH